MSSLIVPALIAGGTAATIKATSKKPKFQLPKLEPEAEQIETIEEEAGDVRRRQRKKLSRGGRRQTILGGIASALKKRLGE